MVEIMIVTKLGRLALVGTLMATIVTGCSTSSQKAAEVPKTLQQQQIAVQGSTPPPGAVAQYLSSQGRNGMDAEKQIKAASDAYKVNAKGGTSGPGH